MTRTTWLPPSGAAWSSEETEENLRRVQQTQWEWELSQEFQLNRSEQALMSCNETGEFIFHLLL